jgi:hypothetical protein
MATGSIDKNFPLLGDRPDSERRKWARWVLGSHSDQFIPEMIAEVQRLDQEDPICYGSPVLSPGLHAEDLLVISSERGRHCFVVDQPLPCRVVLFDFTGEGLEPDANPFDWPTVSISCDGMGQVLDALYSEIVLPPAGNYVGVVCDDVMLRASDVQMILSLGHIHDLSALQPSVYNNHELCDEYHFLRQRSGVSMHRVPIVEVMAPFVRRELMDRVMPFNRGISSAYGIDRFALPLCAADQGKWRFAAVDAAPMTHVRRGRTLRQAYANGLMSKEEEMLVRQRLMLAMGGEIDKDLHSRLERAVVGHS